MSPIVSQTKNYKSWEPAACDEQNSVICEKIPSKSFYTCQTDCKICLSDETIEFIFSTLKIDISTCKRNSINPFPNIDHYMTPLQQTTFEIIVAISPFATLFQFFSIIIPSFMGIFYVFAKMFSKHVVCGKGLS